MVRIQHLGGKIQIRKKTKREQRRIKRTRIEMKILPIIKQTRRKIVIRKTK